MLYLYAITESPDPPDALGLRGAPLRTVGEADAFVVASEHDGLRIEASEEDLWAHEEVVEAAMGLSAVLPIRFGSLLPDEPAVAAMLRERRDALRSALGSVRGAVELGVRAATQGQILRPTTRATNGAGGPGSQYMLERLERRRAGAGVARLIHEPLRALARDSASRLKTEGGPLLTASYLVDVELVERFRDRVEKLQEEVTGATIVCTGPWPPYSFASPGVDS